MRGPRVCALLCTLAVAAGAHALPVQCNTGTVEHRSAKAQCAAASGNAVFYPTLVSVDELLGFNLWLPDRNIFYSEESARTGLGLTGKRVEGVWAIDNLRALLVDGMMIHATGAERERMMAFVRPLPNPLEIGVDTQDLLETPPPQAVATLTDRPVTPAPADPSRGGEAPPGEMPLPDPAEEDDGEEYEGEIDSDCDDEVCPDEPTAVSEPSILALFGLGLVIMGLARRTTARA